MKVYLNHPLYEYRHAHNPSGWKGWWGGRYFWKYGFPDAWRRGWSLRIKIGVPGVYLEL